MLPTVSIIVPVYNGEKFLLQMIGSLLDQTLSNWEAIFIDDGSTDRSREIIEKLANFDPRIQLLTQNHRFAGTARNLGMAHARGEFLVFLDADDFFSPKFLETLYIHAKATSSDIVCCQFRDYFENTKSFGKIRKLHWRGNAFVRGNDLKNEWLGAFDYVPWNKIFRREFIEKIGNKFIETRSSNDITFTCHALLCAEKITILRQTLINYRQHGNAISATRSRHSEDAIAAWNALAERFPAGTIDGAIFKSSIASFYHEFVRSRSREFVDKIREFYAARYDKRSRRKRSRELSARYRLFFSAIFNEWRLRDKILLHWRIFLNRALALLGSSSARRKFDFYRDCNQL